MSDENSNEVDTSCCASCGIAEVDDIKLKDCDGCDLVRYCSDDCQNNHKSQHEEACKKRVAELRDALLFKVPESIHLGDCPICCLPMPLDNSKSLINECCGKFICSGCAFTNKLREVEASMIPLCLFCREPMIKTKKELKKLLMKRVEANDPVAMCFQGGNHCDKGHYSRAFKLFTKAAGLGDAEAHYQLSNMYYLGRFVEKDEGKYIHHLEEASICGHPEARCMLGYEESKNNNIERAVKHYIISATQGSDSSIKMLIAAFKDGLVSKEVLASVLRAHKAAIDATKSPQRLAAEEYERSIGGHPESAAGRS